MKKRVFGVAALLLAAVMALSGCGISTKDVTLMVQGNLDAIYLGTASDEYKKLLSETDEGIKQTYEDGLEIETDVFFEYFQIEDKTEERREQVKELYRNIYAKSTYTVGEAEKKNDGSYVVPVEISPLDIFERVNQDGVDGAIAAVYETMTTEELAALSDEEFEVIWADVIIAQCEAHLEDMETKDPVHVDVKVEKNSDNKDAYMITEDSLAEVDLHIISYSAE